MRMMLDRRLQGIGMTSQRTRERLIGRLEAAGIADQRVLDVMRVVPRHLFVDEALASRAYEESALPIGHGQTISQPHTVARMTEVLRVAGVRGTVLEVGTGCGYQTAVLASLMRRVYSIERIGVLLEQAQRRLHRLELRNIRFRHGDGFLGWPEYAPFDGILVAAAPVGVPRILAEQLANGGTMVLPVGEQEGQMLIRITRTSRGFKHEMLEAASFVPLLGGIC